MGEMMEHRDQRAYAFLRDHLTADQLSTYDQYGWFQVMTDQGSVYYITRALSQHGTHTFNVVAFDSQNAPVGQQFCLILRNTKTGTYDLPHGDVLLAQKLMLETSEQEFLNIANPTWFPGNPVAQLLADGGIRIYNGGQEQRDEYQRYAEGRSMRGQGGWINIRV